MEGIDPPRSEIIASLVESFDIDTPGEQMRVANGFRASAVIASIAMTSALLTACGSSESATEQEAPTVEGILSSLKCENPGSYVVTYSQAMGFACDDARDGKTEIIIFENLAAQEVAMPQLSVPADRKTVMGLLWVLYTYDDDIAINAVQQGGEILS